MIRRTLLSLLVLLIALMSVGFTHEPPPDVEIPYPPPTDTCPQGWTLWWYLANCRYCDKELEYGDYFLFSCLTTDIGFDFNAVCVYPPNGVDPVPPEFRVNLPVIHGITPIIGAPPVPPSE